MSVMTHNAGGSKNKGVEKSHPRLLFIGSLDVAPTYGGPIQFHRHFIERKDFEFHKVVEKPQGRLAHLQTGIQWLDTVANRASQTRFFPHFAALNEWRGIRKSVPHLIQEANKFKPDAIVTVAFGAYGFAAGRVARELSLPLITFFHDWWPDMALQSRLGVAAFDREMRRLYQQSDLAFCVCEEMKSELGGHRNAPVLFPISAAGNAMATAKQPPARPRVVYLGGMTRGYGRMISTLCHTYASIPKLPWELAVFGETKDWRSADVEQAVSSGIYRGQRYGAAAAAELLSADIFLVVMDFEDATRRRVTTSFPSKLLDYCSHGKPVVIWAPDYSSLVRFSGRNPFALVYSENDPAGLIQKITALAQDQNRMEHLANESTNMARTIFSPVNIHEQMVHEISKLLRREK